MKEKDIIAEKASDEVGGGQTGYSKSADPTGTRATLPISNLNNGEPMKKIQDPNNPGEEETDMQNNTKPTGDMSAQNKASVAMKEDMDALFSGEDLTEEFKEKATTIFEAAVNARVAQEVAQLEEQYAQKIEESAAQFVAETEKRIDEYLDYVVQEWMDQNEIAINESLRADITEEFIDGLRQLFAENYIEVPEEKLDVIGELANKVEELEAKLNEAVESSIEMKAKVAEYSKEAIFAEVSEGLVTTQVEKFKTLAEGVDFLDEETYKRKLEIVKENYFADKKVVSNIVESEIESAEEPELNESVKATDPSVARYMSAISRTVKR